MQFNNLTPREKATITYRDIQKRKSEKRKGIKAADEHIFANTFRIQKAVREIKKRGMRYAE
jgi:hypothetical protein